MNGESANPVLYGSLHNIVEKSPDENEETAIRNSNVEGLVGESVRLPCEVDKASCGRFHSIKWYKENDRVFIFSEMAEVKRPEGSLLERTEFQYSEDRKENWLEILPLKTEDEGTYKCEITYLAVKEACSVVQFVKLKTLARPISFELTFEDGSQIENGTTIGPFPEGEDVTLKCQAGGAKPVPSVRWYNGTERIQGRFQSTVDDEGLFVGSNTIQVMPSRFDLGRQLSCEVQNEAMSNPIYLLVNLDVNVPPQSIEIQAQSTVLKEGDQVTLLCSAKGAKPLAVLSWKNGTVPIEETEIVVNIQEEIIEIEMDDGTFETQSKLTFIGTRYENALPFTCEATNGILEHKILAPISHSIIIDVQYPPTVIVRPENATWNESMDFILFCDFTANPIQLTHVYWYLDEHQLDIVGRPEKYRNGNIQHPSLLVVNASADDMGEYTCRVANEVGASEVTNSAYVNIQYRPEVVVLADPEGPVSEDQKPNVTLICDIIRAHPESLTRVRWFLNDSLLKELPECDETETTLNSSRSEFCNVDPSRLMLEYMVRDLHGNYSCEGMNAAGWGERSASTPVVVNHRPGMSVLEYQPEMVVKGHPVTLTCNTLDPGRPIASTYRWTRNSHLMPDITTRVWRIDSASLETQANFTCLPRNSEGDGIMAFASLYVLAQPAFITRLPTYHGALMNANEVSLTCHVECSPNCTISWLKDNLDFDNDTHYSVRNVFLPPDFHSGDFESVKSSLSWKMERWPGEELHRERDNANYTCISSSNIAGEGISSNTIFRVEYPPEGIKISNKLLQVREDQIPEKIDCQASGYPEPNYYWLHGEETVITGSVLNLAFPLKREKGGMYTCVAENRHGKQMISTELDVLYKPECKIDREDTKFGDAPGILLICRAYANPIEVSFRWRLGNDTLVDSVESNGLESRLTLESIQSSFGTYYCYVNNSVGESIPCEIDVTGVAGLFKRIRDDNILMYVIIAVAVFIVLIIIIILIIICKRQGQRGKYTGSANLHNDKQGGRGFNPYGGVKYGGVPLTPDGPYPPPLPSLGPLQMRPTLESTSGRHNHTLPRIGKKMKKHVRASDPTKRENSHRPEVSGKDSSNQTRDNHPCSPSEEGPTFYENLPFHGIQAPPNKISNDETSKALSTPTLGSRRPPSQLSQQASSGYGSTRSQGDIPKAPSKASEGSTRDFCKKNKKDVSFKQNIDEDSEPNSSLKRRGSHSYSSMRNTSVKAAKIVLARTAGYLSVRVPKKTNPFIKSQRLKNNDVQETTKEPSRKMDSEKTLTECDTNNTVNITAQGSPFIMAETSHCLNASSSDPKHSFTFESTQTSTLTLHSNTHTELNNNSPQECSSKYYDSPVKNPRLPCQNSSSSWGNLSPSKDEQVSNSSESLPIPAPRNSSTKVLPPYQNLPSNSSKKINPHSECDFTHPHKMHVLPVFEPLLTGLGSDLEYADVDYSTYTYGPIPYKAESVSAAIEKKAEKECEAKGLPVRPPRKK